MTNKIIPFLMAAILIINGCKQDVYFDGEGNKIPDKVVRLLVMSQYVKVSAKEQAELNRYFPTPVSLDLPEEYPIADSTDVFSGKKIGDTLHIYFNNTKK